MIILDAQPVLILSWTGRGAKSVIHAQDTKSLLTSRTTIPSTHFAWVSLSAGIILRLRMNENLLKIALASLAIYKLDESDIQWVGSECGSYYMHWEMFKIKSSECDFEHLKFGSREPATDLVIVADDWWLSWFDECGQCGFEYNTKPKLKADHKKISRLMGRFSPRLEFINGKKR